MLGGKRVNEGDSLSPLRRMGLDTRCHHLFVFSSKQRHEERLGRRPCRVAHAPRLDDDDDDDGDDDDDDDDDYDDDDDDDPGTLAGLGGGEEERHEQRLGGRPCRVAPRPLGLQ
jgi:hypothetical protein